MQPGPRSEGDERKGDHFRKLGLTTSASSLGVGLMRRHGSGQHDRIGTGMPWLIAGVVVLVPVLKHSPVSMGVEMEEQFERFWKVKPNRRGSNPKYLARVKFIRCVTNGCDPEKIISAAQQWADDETRNKKVGTEFVPMAQTWLNQRRFLDFDQAPEKPVFFPAYPGSAEFNAWKSYYDSSGQKHMVSMLKVRELEGRAWQFQTQWPPQQSG